MFSLNNPLTLLLLGTSASLHRCLTSSNKKLLETSALLVSFQHHISRSFDRAPRGLGLPRLLGGALRASLELLPGEKGTRRNGTEETQKASPEDPKEVV